MPSNRSDIIDDVVTQLSSISVGNGYPLDVAQVEKRSSVPTNPLLPWLGVKKGENESGGMMGMRFFNRMEIEVFGQVTDVDEDETDDRVDELRMSIKRALMLDISRGGNAHWTTLESDRETEDVDERLGQIHMTFEVRWIEDATALT